MSYCECDGESKCCYHSTEDLISEDKHTENVHEYIRVLEREAQQRDVAVKTLQKLLSMKGESCSVCREWAEIAEKALKGIH